MRGRASNLNSTLCQSTEAVWRRAGILTVWGRGDGEKGKYIFSLVSFSSLTWVGMGDPGEVNSPSREIFLKEVFKNAQLYI